MPAFGAWCLVGVGGAAGTRGIYYSVAMARGRGQATAPTMHEESPPPPPPPPGSGIRLAQVSGTSAWVLSRAHIAHMSLSFAAAVFDTFGVNVRDCAADDRSHDVCLPLDSPASASASQGEASDVGPRLVTAPIQSDPEHDWLVELCARTKCGDGPGAEPLRTRARAGPDTCQTTPPDPSSCDSDAEWLIELFRRNEEAGADAPVDCTGASGPCADVISGAAAAVANLAPLPKITAVRS